MTKDIFLIKAHHLDDAYQQFGKDMSCLNDPDTDHTQVLARLRKELENERKQMEKMTHSRSSESCQLARLQLDYCALLEKVLSMDGDHSEKKDEYLALSSEYAIDFAVYAMNLALYMNYEKEENDHDSR